MDNITDKEAIREYLTLHAGFSSGKPTHTVKIKSSPYTIDLCGWITYAGNGEWIIDRIRFNLDKVISIWPGSRKVWLE